MKELQTINLLKILGCEESHAQTIFEHMQRGATAKTIGDMLELENDAIMPIYAEALHNIDYQAFRKLAKDISPAGLLSDAWHQLRAHDYSPLYGKLIILSR